jgi:hypothetical protein
MAGDWIKMRVDLGSDPAVIRISRATGIEADAVVGKLHRLWAWADTHLADGVAEGLDSVWVDEFVGVSGFAESMREAGWLEVKDTSVLFANFGRHNGQPAKTRALAKTRVKRMRCAASVTEAQPEKRREEKREEIQPAAPVPTTEPAKPSRSRAKSLISWAADAGWGGITDADRQGWATAYPGAVLDQELAKASEWLKANPKRAGKRNWRAFLVRWLQRCQDHGGTTRETGRRPDDKPPPKVWKDEYRPAPYRRPHEVVELASTLKLNEEAT